jgi:SNF family Na+-dependent transporter
MFFFMLFIAAITSSLSMLQPAIAFLEQGFDLGRKASVACLCLIVAMGGLIVIYFSKGVLALDTMDFWVGTVCIYILATIQVITVGWVFGIDRAKEEIHRGADLKLPNILWFVIKYVSPLYLLVIFVAFCATSLPKRVGDIIGMDKPDRDAVVFVLIFLALLIIFFTVLVYLAGKRWEAHEARLKEVRI